MRKTSPSLIAAAQTSAARKTTPPPDAAPPRVAALTVKLDKISPSPTNPRKHFDEAKLAELAESIKSKGVLQPILLRPKYRNDGAKKAHADMRPELYWEQPGVWPSMTYELVAGERRFRAAQLAGLVEIPATVRDLTDVQVLEVQVIENDQREDVTPLERADGYARLVEDHGVAVEDLAARVGKSPATIYGLLKLRTLPEKARAALEEGVLSVSVAQLIARVPGEKERDEVLEYALQDDHFDGLPSFRMVKNMIEAEFMVQLKGCSFDRKDAQLLPTAGACTTCPFLTGNRPEEYPDARQDLCLKPSCYKEKVELHAERVAAAARDKGRTVLEGNTASRALWSGEYVQLADACQEHPEQKTYQALIGKALKDKVVVAVTETGKVHQLAKRADVAPLLAEIGVKAKPANFSNDRWKQEERRRQLEGKIRAQVADVAAAEIAAKVELGFATAVGLDAGHARLLRTLVLRTVDKVQHEHRRKVLKRRGIDAKEYDANTQAFEDLAADLDARKLLGLWAELVTTQTLHGGYYENKEAASRRVEVCSVLGVDYAAIDKQVRGERKAKKAAKKEAKQPTPAKSAQEELVEIGLLDSAQPATTSKDYDEALRRSLEQHFDQLASWQQAQALGASDDELRNLIVQEWMRGRPAQSNMTSDLMVTVGKVLSWCRCKGKELLFWHDSLEPKGKPTLKGVEVLAEVRRLKGIRQPKAAGPGDCNVCGCTESQPCEPDGCYWIEPGLCSVCVAKGAEPQTEDGKEAAAMIRHAHEARKLKGVTA